MAKFSTIKFRENFIFEGNINKSGRLVTNSTNADQLILSYGIPITKRLNIHAISFKAQLQIYAQNPVILGNWSVEIGVGNKILTQTDRNTSRALPPPFNYNVPEHFDPPVIYMLDEPLVIPAGSIFRFVCTPSTITPIVWMAKFSGYLK